MYRALPSTVVVPVPSVKPVMNRVSRSRVLFSLPRPSISGRPVSSDTTATTGMVNGDARDRRTEGQVEAVLQAVRNSGAHRRKPLRQQYKRGNHDADARTQKPVNAIASSNGCDNSLASSTTAANATNRSAALAALTRPDGRPPSPGSGGNSSGIVARKLTAVTNGLHENERRIKH